MYICDLTVYQLNICRLKTVLIVYLDLMMLTSLIRLLIWQNGNKWAQMQKISTPKFYTLENCCVVFHRLPNYIGLCFHLFTLSFSQLPYRRGEHCTKPSLMNWFFSCRFGDRAITGHCDKILLSLNRCFNFRWFLIIFN